MYTLQKLIKTVFFPKFFILNCTYDLFSVLTNKYYNNVDNLYKKNLEHWSYTLFKFSVWKQ